MDNALAKLDKELVSLTDEPLSIEVQNYHILALIDSKLIIFDTFEGEVAYLEEGLETYQRFVIRDYISKGKLPQEKSQAHQIMQHALFFVIVGGTLY